jgi:predicted ATPase/DNA-binding SARP family transcriptional activator
MEAAGLRNGRMADPRRMVQAKHSPRSSSARAPEALRIRMLGGFSVCVGTRAIEEGEWRLRKAASLVKLLALTPGHRLHRERVTDLLWPNLRPRAATNNLRQALHAARRILDPGTTKDAAERYLGRRGELLELCPGGLLSVDVEAFEEAAATARRSRNLGAYEAALELYTGELLPADLYEEWAEERREGLRGMYLALLLELAKLYEEQGRAEEAIEVLGRVVAAESVREEAHARLMRLYALTGRTGEALAQYERLQEALSSTLGAEPGAASRRLCEEILAGRVSPSQPARTDRPPEEHPGVGKHNLPALRTSLLGRERELVEVKRALAMTRLLTLTGAGGSGKTRLALEVSKYLIGAYEDGVWLVELASLSDPDLVPQAVASTLGVHEAAGRPLTETVAKHLRSKKTLLVLDNCEHLVEACAALADVLLGACPDLRVLATSREPLSIAGEVTWPVPSLSLPDDPLRLPSLEECRRYGAVRLFVERAEAADNMLAVLRVCRRLDGMPLAIELAAARTRVLSVEQIANRLDESFRLLRSDSRTVLPRQQTLQATVDWSHGLLSEKERVLFRRLSVFSGGFTLEAAEVVCVCGEGLEQDEILDLLTHLADKSLVVVRERRGEMRYRFLEAVRQYGWEKLEESGEAEAIGRTHASLFLALAEKVESRIDPKNSTADRRPWLERLEAEHDNLRATLRWAAETGEAEMALRLACGLFWFWHTRGYRGYLSEGRYWFDRALAVARTPTAARAEALYCWGYLAWIQGDLLVARSRLEESVATWREIGGRQGGLAHALWHLGLVTLALGEPVMARSLSEESMQLFRMLEGDEFGLSMSLAVLGLTVATQGYYALASSLLKESEAIARKVGDDWFLSLTLRYLGAAAFAKATTIGRWS